MSSLRITRRSAAILIASLPYVARGATLRPDAGIEVHFIITRAQRQPSGDMSKRSYESAMLMASGETMEVDIRDEFRINMQTVDHGDYADVRIKVWDNRETGDLAYAGDGMVRVPVGGEASLTLLKSDNIQYPIELKATRQAFPKG